MMTQKHPIIKRRHYVAIVFAAAVIAGVLTTGFSLAAPSGQDMPLGNLDGWRQIFADDFTVDAPKGSWGSECDWEQIAYQGENQAPGASSQQSHWRSYPRCFRDGQQRPYRADEVLSVHDGILDFDLGPIDGQPAGASPSPLVTGTQYQTYGRYDVRMRVTNPDMTDYRTSFMLWPEGDADYLESASVYPRGSLADDSVHALHYQSPDNDAFSAPVDKTEWHTYTQEWGPDFRAYYIDGELIGHTSGNVWDGPERWQFQLETSGNNGDLGHVEFDWVTAYAWDPEASEAPPTQEEADILFEDFEGRGQPVAAGTRLDGANSFARIDGRPVAGWYENGYGNRPDVDFVHPHFSAAALAGDFAGAFGIQNFNYTGGEKGGSFYHYYNTTEEPWSKLYSSFYWKFDSAMGNASPGAYPALTALMGEQGGGGGGDILTLLRFIPSGSGSGWLEFENGNWSRSGGSYEYQPDTWYRVLLELDANSNQSRLVVRDLQGNELQDTTFAMADRGNIVNYELGAFQGVFSQFPSPSSFSFDDLALGTTPAVWQ